MCHGLDRSNVTYERSRVLGFAQWTNLLEENYLMTIKKILLAYGPVTTRFRAPKAFFWNNLAGPMNLPCVFANATKIPPQDHAMLIVGWTETHLIIKNSYGNYDSEHDRWGEAGYLYLNNQFVENCGIVGKDSEITFPAVA